MQSARLLARLGRFSEAIAAAQEARQIDPLTPPGVDALIVEGICLANTDDLITEPFAFVDGTVMVPQGPGLGIEVDRAKLDRYRV